MRSTSTETTAPPAKAQPKPGVSVGFSDLYFEEYAAAIALLVVVASVSWGVFTRYVSHTPAIWTGEMARIAFAWTVFLGAAAGFRRSEHIIIDVLLPLLPDALAKAVKQLANLIVLVVLIAMTILSIRFTISTFHALTTVLRLPQSVIYGAPAVGFALMTWRHIQAVREAGLSTGKSANVAAREASL